MDCKDRGFFACFIILNINLHSLSCQGGSEYLSGFLDAAGMVSVVVVSLGLSNLMTFLACVECSPI